MDNPDGMTDDEINAKIIDEADSTWFILKTDDSTDIQMASSSLLSTTKPAPQQTTKPSGNTGNTDNSGSAGGNQSSNGDNGGIIVDGDGPAMNDGWTPPEHSDIDYGGLH